jgi:tetratricopeptide (TPR) repeat protein
MKIFSIFFVFLVTVFPVQGYCSIPLYLENEIHAALVSRDTYYKSAGVEQLLFPSPTLDNTRLDSLRMKCAGLYNESVSVSEPLWANLLAGLAVSGKSPKAMNDYFEKALTAASSDPGRLWVLAKEFDRFGQQQWERICLEQLEKLLVLRGSSSSPAVAQQLLYKAVSSDRKGQETVAGEYYAISRQFDRHLVWPIVRSISSAFPLRIATMFEGLEKCTSFLAHSWAAQLSLVLAILLLIRTWLAILVIGSILIIGFKYAPSVLHWVIELFPRAVSRRWKKYFSFALFASFASLGVLPLLWLVIFLTWKFCSRRDKRILGIGCLMLILFPVSVRLEDMVRQCLMPEGSISLFRKALEEGYYPDLDRTLRAAAHARPGDYLAQTAAALCASKGDDLAAAHDFIRKARSMCGNDPAVLLTEGIVFYLSGQFEKARGVYDTCQQLFPDYVAAYFNYGQCYLASTETLRGMEYLDRATKINPAAVNAFISQNDEMFSKKWPRLRQFMPPEYSCRYFWTRIFPRYWGSWTTSDALWGASFLGMPLWCYGIFSMLLFPAILLIDFFVWSIPRAAKIFQCKLCEAAMCRKCKKGVICEHCFDQLHQIRNENIRQRIIERILLQNRRMQNIGALCIDVLFPGGGMLYKSTKAPVVPLLLMGIAALGYACLIMPRETAIAYPFWVIKDFMNFAYLTIPLYNVGFAVRAVVKIVKEFKT